MSTTKASLPTGSTVNLRNFSTVVNSLPTKQSQIGQSSSPQQKALFRPGITQMGGEKLKNNVPKNNKVKQQNKMKKLADKRSKKLKMIRKQKASKKQHQKMVAKAF